MGGHNIYIPKKEVNLFYPIKFGLFYNSYAFSGTGDDSISSGDDWAVPSIFEMQTLADALGASGDYATNLVGGDMKVDDSNYWDSPNTGATNSSKLNFKGAGFRNADTGVFDLIRESGVIWSSTDYLGIGKRTGRLSNLNAYFICRNASYAKYKTGYPIRLLRTATAIEQLLPDFSYVDNYIGNDFKEYRAVKIGTQIWMADNLAETQLRAGAIIPWYGANPANYFTDSEWTTLSSAGCCAYNNDPSNVAIGFSFPT